MLNNTGADLVDLLKPGHIERNNPHAPFGAAGTGAGTLFGDFDIPIGTSGNRRGTRVAASLDTEFGHLLQQILDPLPAAGNRFNHGKTEFLTQFFNIDFHPAPARHIDHVQSDHDRPIQFFELFGQIEIAFQCRGIDNIDNGIVILVAKIIAGNFFFVIF